MHPSYFFRFCLVSFQAWKADCELFGRTRRNSQETNFTMMTKRFLTTILSATTGLFLAAAALGAPGDLDSSFGANGKVFTQFPAQTTTFRERSGVWALAIQPDGKIVAGGYAFISPNGVANAPAFALTRYNPNGSLDSSFGTGGKVTTYFNGYEEVHAIALQPDGKIVVSGFTDLGGSNFAFALARYNTNGTLDTSFDGDGKFVKDLTPGLDEAEGLAIQPDGKILVSGFINAGVATDFGTLRLTTGGGVDGSFGDAGLARTDFGGVEGGTEIALFSDGRFVVAGSAFASDGGGGDFALVGYNSDGSLDSTFGTGGKVITDFASASLDNAADMAVAPDGKIVVSGYSGPPGAYDFAVARYNRNGTLDTTFDGDGKFRVDVTGSGRIDGANAVAVQQNGKIVLSGRAQLGSETPFDVAVVRVNPTGGLDSNFGSNGKVFTDFADLRPNSFNATNDEFRDLLIQPDGRILTGGEIEDQTRIEYDMALARYIGDPVTPRRSVLADFNGDGRSDISVFRPTDRVWHVLNSAGNYSATQFGLDTDTLAPADYDGDGKTDIGVFRNGTWYFLNSSTGAVSIAQFGLAGDIALPADYDGDGRAELAVFRSGIWYTLRISDSRFRADQFGLAGDRPVPADFDGDGKADYAVYRAGTWYWLRSSDSGFRATQFGLATDLTTVGDYDGDGKADPAVYRSGVWYILRSSEGFYAGQFGIASDIPAAADYDGDGRTDLAVYRDGIWYILRSQQGVSIVQFGIVNDKPVQASFGGY